MSEPATTRGVGSVALLVGLAHEQGLGNGGALRGTGVRVADLADPDAQVTAEQELRAVRNLLAVLPAELHADAGRRLGERYHVSTFGALGFALLSSPTLGEAVDVALRFWDLSFAFAAPRVTPVARGGRRITLETHGVPADVETFVRARDAAAIRQVLAELLPGTDPPAFGDGAGADGALLLPGRYLARPLPQGDPQTRAAFEAMCADVVSRRRARSGLAQRVRVVVTQRLADGAPMEAVAADLGLTPRTLRRRLGAEGTSYRALVEEVRDSLAAELLATGRLSVADVALRLGYAEASTFIAAFRRWRGRTPAAWRAAQVR